MEVKKSNPTFATASEEETKSKTKMFNNKYKDMRKTIEQNLEMLENELKKYQQVQGVETNVFFYKNSYYCNIKKDGFIIFCGFHKDAEVVKEYIKDVEV